MGVSLGLPSDNGNSATVSCGGLRCTYVYSIIVMGIGIYSIYSIDIQL